MVFIRLPQYKSVSHGKQIPLSRHKLTPYGIYCFSWQTPFAFHDTNFVAASLWYTALFAFHSTYPSFMTNKFLFHDKYSPRTVISVFHSTYSPSMANIHASFLSHKAHLSWQKFTFYGIYSSSATNNRLPQHISTFYDRHIWIPWWTYGPIVQFSFPLQTISFRDNYIHRLWHKLPFWSTYLSFMAHCCLLQHIYASYGINSFLAQFRIPR